MLTLRIGGMGQEVRFKSMVLPLRLIKILSTLKITQRYLLLSTFNKSFDHLESKKVKFSNNLIEND